MDRSRESKNKTSSVGIKKLKNIFSRLGIPKFVYIDNNPFHSLEYQTLSKE